MNTFFRFRHDFVVVASGNGQIIGILYKHRLVRELSELNEEEDLLERIPAAIMDVPTEEILYECLKKQDSVAVVGLDGSYQGNWGRIEVIRALEKVPVPPVKKFEPPAALPAAPSESFDWFKELLLENIRHPLYVSDLDGNTLFYNRSFKKEIVNYPRFGTLQKTEQYFHEANRRITAELIRQGRDLNEAYESEEAVAGYIFILTPLHRDGALKGYLYEFLPRRNQNSQAEQSQPEEGTVIEGPLALEDDPEAAAKKAAGLKKPAVDSNLYEKLESTDSPGRLNSMLAEYERRIIDISLARHKNNISHTAEYLGIPRQTLQFRLRKLFPPIELPSASERKIPRRRRKLDDGSVEPVPSPPEKSPSTEKPSAKQPVKPSEQAAFNKKTPKTPAKKKAGGRTQTKAKAKKTKKG